MALIDDDYYQDGFENYKSTTTDPGPWMVIGVSLYSICCVLVFLPISVIVGKKCRKRRNKKKESKGNDINVVVAHKKDNRVVNVSNAVVIDSATEIIENKEKSDDTENIDLENQVVSKHHSISWPDILRAISQIQFNSGKTREDSSIEHSSNLPGSPRVLNVNNLTVTSSDEKDLSKLTTSTEVITSSVSSAELEKEPPIPTTTSTRTRRNRKRIKKRCLMISNIVACDKETQRILKLGGPFTAAAVSEAAFDAIILALVSKYLGVDALSAMVVAELLVGLTDTFVNGVGEALETLCPHAIGTENYNLAGEYVQIAIFVFLIASLPIVVAWWFFMDDAIRLFGMNERVVRIGTDYSKIVMADYLINGIFDIFLSLLDVTGYASPATFVALLEGTISFLSVWGLLHYVDTMNLFWVGVAELGVALLVYSIFVIFVLHRGWLDPFWHGMTKSFALKNSSAVKNVLQTTIPLSIGSLLEYGEWEALTFFAAALGPAEVVAWGILESIWDLFEAATEGLSEAGSMRLAFHLGRGHAQISKLSCWKTLYLSTILACALSTAFIVLSPYIPPLFTDDETLAEMVQAQLPLIGVGNIFMVFGMTSWNLIGAQGRYKTATIISATMTVFVTLPLAALFCIGMRYSLISLVGAVVIGYSTTGLALGYILQMSDWEHISKVIRALNEKDELESSSDDDSDEEEYDCFEDNVNSKSISLHSSPDHRTDSGSKILIKSIDISEKDRIGLMSYPESIRIELLILAQEISSNRDANNTEASSEKIASLTEKIMDLEAQVHEKNSTIENLRGDIRTMQDLYGAELSDLLGRIKKRVRQTSEVLLSGCSSEKSIDVSYVSSAKEESQSGS